MLLNHRNLVLQDPDIVAGALDLFQAKPKLGFSNCLMVRRLAKVDVTQRL